MSHILSETFPCHHGADTHDFEYEGMVLFMEVIRDREGKRIHYGAGDGGWWLGVFS